jgi:acetolactate synthase-1/2/3 large subunit
VSADDGQPVTPDTSTNTAATTGHGGAMVARTLAALGTEVIFTVSGNQVLPIFDAAGDHGLRLLHMRHESAAVYAAAGYAEQTGRPGVALVSAGPGFLAALMALAVVRAMELPVLLLSGDTPEADGPGAFQALDQVFTAAPYCRQSSRVANHAEIAQALVDGWALAQMGVPGPVHIALPSDVLREDGALPHHLPAASFTHDVAMLGDEIDVTARLATAERPAIIVRPAAMRGAAGAALRRIAATLGVTPIVAESPRGFSDPRYADLLPLLREADVVLAVASADFTTGWLERSVLGDADLLLVAALGDLSPRTTPVASVTGDLALVLTAIADTLPEVTPAADWSARWQLAPPPTAPTASGDTHADIHPLEMAEALGELLRPTDTLVLDGGECAQWMRLGWRDLPQRMLWNSTLGAIGGAIPLALGAAAGGATRVIVVAGDGGVGYHIAEMETAEREWLPIIVVVGNDARWGAEWHQQIAKYGPERTFGTALLPARYDVVAAGFGVDGWTVDAHDDLLPRLRQALESGRPGLVNVHIACVASPAVVTH